MKKLLAESVLARWIAAALAALALSCALALAQVPTQYVVSPTGLEQINVTIPTGVLTSSRGLAILMCRTLGPATAMGQMQIQTLKCITEVPLLAQSSFC